MLKVFLIKFLMLSLLVTSLTGCGNKESSEADPNLVGDAPLNPSQPVGPQTPVEVYINQDNAQPDPSPTLPVVYYIVFSRAINPGSFDLSDIQNTGTATGVTWELTNSGNDISYELKAIATATQGTIEPVMIAAAVTDTYGNISLGSLSNDNSVLYATSLNVIIDQKVAQLDPTGIFPIEFDIVFSSPIDPATFTLADISQNGTATGVVWNLINSGDDRNYTLQATNAATGGTIIPSLPANQVQTPPPTSDNNLASTSIDNTVLYAPNFDVTVEQKLAQLDPTTTFPIEFDVAFSEAIDPATFDPTDITQNGTAGGLVWNLINSGDNQNFTLQLINAGSEGTVIPSIDFDKVATVMLAKNNASTSVDNSVTLQFLVYVTIDQKLAQIDPADVLPVEFDVVFSEPIDPATFTTADITQDGTATGVTWNIINSGDNLNFTLQVTAAATDGTLEPSMAGFTVQTLAFKDNYPSTSTDNSVTLDRTFDVTINQKVAQADPTDLTPIEFDVVFSEAIDPATFIPTDITQVGTALGITWNIINSGDDINFTLQATVVGGDGTVQPSLPANLVQTVTAKNNNASTSTDNEVTYDTSIDVTINQKVAQVDPTNTLPIEFDVVFEEAIDPATFTPSDITQNGTAIGITWNIINSGDDTNFTLQAQAVNVDGTVTPSLAAAAVQTVALSNNNASTSTDNEVTFSGHFNLSIDQKVAQLDPTSTLPIEYDIVFSEAIDPATFVVGDVTQAGTATGVTWNLINSGDDINFTLQATALTSDGTVIPVIAADLIQTVAGKNNYLSTSTDNEVTYDATFDVTINQKVAQLDPTMTLPIEFDVVFSEAIDPATFVVGDIAQLGTAPGVTWNIINSGDDINFTLQATAATGDGTVQPSLAANMVQTVALLNNNANTFTDDTVTLDTVVNVTIDQKVAQVDPSAALPIEFDVVFDEAIDPATFIPADITQNGTATGITWNIINSGDDMNFTLQATAATSDGTVEPYLDTSMVQTVGAKPNAASTSTDGSVTYDTKFDITIDQKVAQLDPTMTVPIEYDVVFDEAIDPATFTTADIVQNGTATGITWNLINSGDDINFTLQATAVTGDGTVIPSISATVIQTVSLKDNNASTSTDNSVTYDTKFDVTVEQKVAQLDPTNVLPIEFDVVFSEAIDPATFTTADITQNGTATGVTWNLINSGDDINFTRQATAATFVVGDITQSGMATGVTWNIINSGDDINFTLQATAITGDGTVVPVLAASAVQTVGGKNNNASTSVDNTVTYSTNFDITIEQKVAQADPATVFPVEFDVVMERAIVSGTFTTADITQNGTATGVTWNIINSGDDTNFTLQATNATAAGTIIPSIGAGLVTEVLGSNLNSASTSVDNSVSFIFPATQIVFVTEPVDVAVNGTMANFTVEFRDASDNLVSSETSNVTLTFANDPSGIANIGGNATRAAVDGVATFNDITIDQAGVGFTFTATAGAFTDTSAAFEVIYPAITSVTPPSNATYASGQNLDFTATMNTSVTVTGTPQIQLDIGGNTEFADYQPGLSNATSLVFRYVVQATDEDLDGIGHISPVGLNGGTIQDVALNNATLTFTPADTSGVTIQNASPGITVSDISGVTAEDGTTATFTVVLDSPPSNDVTIDLSSSDETEGTINGAVANNLTLTFTNANWNTPQLVTITGVDDSPLVDGNQIYTIVTAGAVSADGNYSGLNANDVTVTNLDSGAAPGITVTAISGQTSETGTTATFSIYLNTAPTDDVTIDLSSSDETEGTINGAVANNLTLTFTSANWSTAQVVTLTGQDDILEDSDQNYTIITAAASSLDTNYNGMDPVNVLVTNLDDDSFGVQVSAISGNTDETGTIATFTVRLKSAPTADVTIPVSSSDTGEGQVDTSLLTFTTANWMTEQTVTVTGQDDIIQDGDQVYIILLAASSSTDLNYDNIDPTDHLIQNIDDDSIGINVSAISGPVNETGTTATFSIVLTSLPSADVNIALSSNDTGEGTIDLSSVTFTTANWSTPQIVTLTGVDDALQDGSQTFKIVTAAATGAAEYAGINPVDVDVQNNDDDSHVVIISQNSGHTTNEIGTQSTFTISLGSPVAASETVQVNLTSGDTGEVTVSPASVTFNDTNWASPQTVTLTGIQDVIQDGTQFVTITTSNAISGDPNYSGINVDDITVSNFDDDSIGILVTPATATVPTNRIDTSEAGLFQEMTIVLTSQPTADVTIPITSSDTSEGTVSVSQVVFNDQNWNVPQTISIVGQDDAGQDGDIEYDVQTGAATSADGNYDGFDAADVYLTNLDNDSPGVLLSEDTSSNRYYIYEGGLTQHNYTYVLKSQPTADVTITLSSSDTTEATISPTSITFTPENWNIPQGATTFAVDDANSDGDRNVNINASASSADGAYNGIGINQARYKNIDDERAEIICTPDTRDVDGERLVTTEGVTSVQIQITLTRAPTDDVFIDWAINDTSEGSLSSTSHTFTPENWQSPHVITVTGMDDAIVDGTVTYKIDFNSASSNDDGFDGERPPDAWFENLDND